MHYDETEDEGSVVLLHTIPTFYAVEASKTRDTYATYIRITVRDIKDPD